MGFERIQIFEQIEEGWSSQLQNARFYGHYLFAAFRPAKFFHSAYFLLWSIKLFVSRHSSPFFLCDDAFRALGTVRLSAGLYQDLINWYCSLLTWRKVCGRAAGITSGTQTKPSQMKPDIIPTQSWRYNYEASPTNTKKTLVEFIVDANVLRERRP